MYLAVPSGVLHKQVMKEIKQPHVVVVGITSPDGGRVVLVCDFVHDVVVTVTYPVSRAHHLSILKDHLDGMLITMILGAT